jgi:hypothetical protein
MLEHDLLVFIRKLNQLGAPYMVTGSWATTLYGKPRMTYDVGIIIRLHLRDIRVMLEISSEGINRADLEPWIRQRGLESEWAAAQRASD